MSRSTKKWLYGQSAAWMRWLHIYLSMFSFAAMMFFSVTGITLNHPDWFTNGEPLSTDISGAVPEEWCTPEVDKLQIAETLRMEHRLRGRVSEVEIDDYECMIVFKGPGYSADIFVDRSSGKYDGVINASGFIAIVNDLHKGRDSGEAWSWIIDLSALLGVIVSLTGFGLLLYLRRRKRAGLLTSLAGALLMVAIWFLFAH